MASAIRAAWAQPEQRVSSVALVFVEAGLLLTPVADRGAATAFRAERIARVVKGRKDRAIPYIFRPKHFEAGMVSVPTAQYSRGTKSRLLLVVIASTAGFVGGLISNCLLPHVAHAQNRDIPSQVWAHEFVLAGKDGVAVEVIGIERDGLPSMEFRKRDGRIKTVRFHDGSSSVYVGGGPRHPTLLPIKP